MPIEIPDVSVLMAVHNGFENYPAHTLQDAIEMTLYEQPGVEVELCITDDASTDETWARLDDWVTNYTLPDQRVTLVRHSTNKGPAAAYQSSAERATGRYCILQSARSWYEPGCFRDMVDVLDDQPEVGFVYGRTQYSGARFTLYTPPPFVARRFLAHFDSLFGYLYRREALEAGCCYIGYLPDRVTGRNVDIGDYDFVMQLICQLGWKGLALRDRTVLHYLYSGEGQMTNLVHRYQKEIDAIFQDRWGAYADRLAG